MERQGEHASMRNMYERQEREDAESDRPGRPARARLQTTVAPSGAQGRSLRAALAPESEEASTNESDDEVPMRLHVIGVMMGVLALCGSAHAQTLLPYSQGGYRYAIVTSFPAGAEAETFDESGLAVGAAPFGSINSNGCLLSFATNWPIGYGLLARYHLVLPGIPLVPVLSYGIDNDVRIYVNGVRVADTVHEGCARFDEFAVRIPDGLLHGGDNVIAVLAVDRGGVSAFDMSISAQGLTPNLRATWGRVKLVYR